MIEHAETFEQYYIDSYPKLYHVAYRLTGNPHDAEDVLQEAFLQAYKSYAGFRQDCSFNTWLFRILINCANKHIKKRKKLPVADLVHLQSTSEEDILHLMKTEDIVVDTVITSNLREYCLQMFINCMPQKQRIAFSLKVLLGVSIEEAARIMNVSESAVKTNIHRARQLMKANMEGRCSLINPQNPCQCGLWAKYLVKNQLSHKLPDSGMVATNSEQVHYEQLLGEVRLMERLIAAYRSNARLPSEKAADEFVQRMKRMINQKKFKFLS